MLHQNFESYKPEVQELICVADRLGSLMQYETPGFLPNKRIHRGILFYLFFFLFLFFLFYFLFFLFYFFLFVVNFVIH